MPSNRLPVVTISIDEKLPVLSLYVYEQAGFVLVIETLFTYMLNGPSSKFTSPPALEV